MNRRTFLKGLFAAAVTPASCVRALYRPKEKIFFRGVELVYEPNLVYKGPVNFICKNKRYNGVIELGKHVSWKNYTCGYAGDGVTEELKEKLRAEHRTTKFQPPKRRS